MTAPAAEGSSRSLQLNIAANYAGQLYVGLLGILMVPIYLRVISAEAYGLVGFFALLQAWSQLLDLGLSATVSREAARHAHRAQAGAAFRPLLHSFEWVFWPVGLLMGAGLVLAAGPIADRWLDVRDLPAAEVRAALQLMAASVAMRWVSALYRGVLVGVERQVWLNGFNAAIITLRFLVVLPVMHLFGSSLIVFFGFQLLVSVAELGGLAGEAYRRAPTGSSSGARASWSLLRPALRFSGGVGVATVVWILVTQADKLVISTVLPLAEYGYFTAAVTAAGAVSLLSAAVSQALLPRLTQLGERPSQDAFFTLYRQATQWTVIVGGPLALCLMLFARTILWAWTGNAGFSARYALVLALYAAGNAVAALAVFPYYLQYARGDMRLHVRASVVFAVVLVPAVLWAASAYGALGSAWVWAAGNSVFFLGWSPIVHRKFAPGLHASWLRGDVLRVASAPVAIGVACSLLVPRPVGRIEGAAWVVLCGIAMTAGGLGMSNWGRDFLRRRTADSDARVFRGESSDIRAAQPAPQQTPGADEGHLREGPQHQPRA